MQYIQARGPFRTAGHRVSPSLSTTVVKTSRAILDNNNNNVYNYNISREYGVFVNYKNANRFFSSA